MKRKKFEWTGRLILIIFSLNNSPLIAIIMITALAGALCGFLPFNFAPAKT